MKQFSRDFLSSFFRTGLYIMSASLLLTILLKATPELRSAGGTAWSSLPVPMNRLPTEQPLLALTFDAAWYPSASDASGTAKESEPAVFQELLSVLQSEQADAAFFLSEGWLTRYPDTVKSISDAGQDIGFLWDSSCSDLENGIQTLENLTGKSCCFVRPAHGEYNDAFLADCRRLELTCILWTLDSEDWKDYKCEALTAFVLNQSALREGSIIRFHAGSRRLTEALPFLIRELRDQGYGIISLSQLSDS